MTDEPVACELTTKDAATQYVEWHELGRLATSIDKIRGGAVVTFPSGLLDTITDLAVLESRCCAFLTLSIATEHGETRLSITSDNPDALPVIEALTVSMRR